MVRQMQTLMFDKRHYATEPARQTDYVKVAEGFGAKATRIRTKQELETAFRDAMQYDGPYLIEIPIDKEELVLPMLPPGGAIDDIITQKEDLL